MKTCSMDLRELSAGHLKDTCCPNRLLRRKGIRVSVRGYMEEKMLRSRLNLKGSVSLKGLQRRMAMIIVT